ncbi:hypothetical protein BBP40_001326 [Aspergillus hancockii]|nr:hypothetical protein BBP40_001326 [Aspergillus hancockii]
MVESSGPYHVYCPSVWLTVVLRSIGLGPVVRCGPNHLSFDDPDMIPIVYHRQADKVGYPQDITCPGATANKSNHAEYAASKRLFGQAFSATRVKPFESLIDETTSKWMLVLREEAVKCPQVQWHTWANYFTFDVWTQLSLGEDFGLLDTKSDVDHMIASGYKVFRFWKLSRYPPIAWLAQNTALGNWMLGNRRTDKHGVGPFKEKVHQIIKQRTTAGATQKRPVNGDTMIDQWLSARTLEGDSIPLTDIEDQLVSDLLGGPYALSVMVTGLLYLMASHPTTFKRAQKEVDDAFSQLRPSQSSLTFIECCSLPFVTACISESLRLTATGSPRGRCTPDRPLVLMGKQVPPGTAVSTSPFAITTHRNIYGETADTFMPERWLHASEEQLRLWKSYDAHWGFGIRKCPGRHIGMMVLYKALVLHDFDVQREKHPPEDDGIFPASPYLVMMPRDSERIET